MLVKKGGISRNIDERRLHEYKAKGYAPVKEPEQDAANKPAKEPEQKEPNKPAKEPEQNVPNKPAKEAKQK